MNNPQKIAQILVSAYPSEMPVLMYEMVSDNITDNGPLYSVSESEQTAIQSYKYQDVTDLYWDIPQRVWGVTYKAIASANQALAAIEELGNPEETEGSKAEALLCRAFGHFILANTFCIAYNPVSSNTDLGIPDMEASRNGS
ncbi:RagB/SusD family nutrient uptake outer membrane protein [Dysgonomonas sp. Marseille-P4677]|nr:RagB/SusD family nutrient uptake outer membrane protein [Dysgonomonas sp. Marseille-P4677]